MRNESERAPDDDRQDRDLKELETALRSFGDVEVAIPASFLAELEDLCTSSSVSTTLPPSAIRG